MIEDAFPVKRGVVRLEMMHDDESRNNLMSVTVQTKAMPKYVLSSDEYAKQELALGRRLHKHAGVWWVTLAPGLCRPLLRWQPYEPGTVRPSWTKSFFGYYHSIVTGAGNGTYVPMILQRTKDTTFEIRSISAKRRSNVRRGLKKSQIRRISDTGDHLDEMLDIVVSARKRTGAGQPESYYVQAGSEWKQHIHALLQCHGRYCFGSFVQDRLVAYFFCTAVEDTFIIDAAKSHSEFLSYYVNDALLYSAIDFAFNGCGSNRIIYGDYAPDDAALNYFKQSYDFVPTTIYEKQFFVPGVKSLYRYRAAISRFLGKFRAV